MQMTDLHYGENEYNDVKNDQIIKKLIDLDNPQIVVLTGDIISGSQGQNIPKFYQKNHKRLRKNFSQYPNIQQMMTLGTEDSMANLSAKEIVDQDSKYDQSLTYSMTGDSTNQYLIVASKYTGISMFALFILDSGGRDCYDTEGWCGVSLEVVKWVDREIGKLVVKNQKMKILVYMHKPIQELMMVQNLDESMQIKKGFMGLEPVSCSELNSGLYNVAKKQSRNVVGMYFGHDHKNDQQVMDNDKSLMLGQGRKTGYGGQGSTDGQLNGARVVDLILDDNLTEVVGVLTQLRLEDGSQLFSKDQEGEKVEQYLCNQNMKDKNY